MMDGVQQRFSLPCQRQVEVLILLLCVSFCRYLISKYLTSESIFSLCYIWRPRMGSGQSTRAHICCLKPKVLVSNKNLQVSFSPVITLRTNEFRGQNCCSYITLLWNYKAQALVLLQFLKYQTVEKSFLRK